MPRLLECIWKCSFAILVLYMLLVKAEDSTSEDSDVDKRRYNHMFVGKRFNHMFVGKRFNHMFVGKRFNHMFVGKRFNHMFVGKRFNHMFVGKRLPGDNAEDSENKYGYYFLGKRRATNPWSSYFVGKRPLAYRMFVGKRDGDDEGFYDGGNAEGYYNEDNESGSPFVSLDGESDKETQNSSR